MSLNLMGVMKESLEKYHEQKASLWPVILMFTLVFEVMIYGRYDFSVVVVQWYLLYWLFERKDFY